MGQAPRGGMDPGMGQAPMMGQQMGQAPMMGQPMMGQQMGQTPHGGMNGMGQPMGQAGQPMDQAPMMNGMGQPMGQDMARAEQARAAAKAKGQRAEVRTLPTHSTHAQRTPLNFRRYLSSRSRALETPP